MTAEARLDLDLLLHAGSKDDAVDLWTSDRAGQQAMIAEARW